MTNKLPPLSPEQRGWLQIIAEQPGKRFEARSTLIASLRRRPDHVDRNRLALPRPAPGGRRRSHDHARRHGSARIQENTQKVTTGGGRFLAFPPVPLLTMAKEPNMSREWELEGQTHRTARDAHTQLNKAKLGAHVAATNTYLLALRAKLSSWIEEIDSELFERDRQAALAEEFNSEIIAECDCDRSGIGGTHEDHCAIVVL